MVKKDNLRLSWIARIRPDKYVSRVRVTMNKPEIEDHLPKNFDEYLGRLEWSIGSELFLESIDLINLGAANVLHDEDTL